MGSSIVTASPDDDDISRLPSKNIRRKPYFIVRLAAKPRIQYDQPLYFERPLIATSFNSLSLWERVGVRVKNRKFLPFTV
jgi:hypothetical protein